MVFKVNIDTHYNTKTTASHLFINARRNILLYPEHSTELLLDKYIKNKYKKSLKQLSLEVLSMAKFSEYKNYYKITFMNKKIDKLAAFITYGNRTLRGSNILRDAIR